MPFSDICPAACRFAFASWRGLIAGVLWVLAVGCARAEDVSFLMQSWRTTDGLPQNSVGAIAHTADGYLWVGTMAGVARFDGVRFTVYGLGEGLRRPHISALADDGEGGVWIGTYGGGLSRLHDGVLKTLTTEDGLAGNTVSALATAGSGGIWVGGSNGLQRWTQAGFQTFGEAEGLPASEVSDIAVGAGGAVWVSMGEAGLFRLSDGRFAPVLGPKGKKLVRPYLLVERSGALWASIGNGVLLRLVGDVWTEFNESDGVPSSVVQSLAESASGEIWAGSAEGGLFVFRGGRFLRVAGAPGELDPAIRALYAAPDGAMWVGTRAGGLCRLSPPRVRSFPLRVKGRNGEITTLIEEGEGSVWVGTYGGGLFRGPLENLAPVEGVKKLDGNPFVLGGLRLRSGDAWFFGYKLLLQKPARGSEFRTVETPHTWMAACEDSAGGVWMGTALGELWKIADGAPHKVDGGALGASIRVLRSDGAQGVWAATGSGLFRWEAGKTRQWSVAEGLPANSLTALLRDREGALWIGTEGGGLALLRDGRLHVVSVAQGLGDAYIKAILDDDAGHLWLGCNRGIYRVAKSELEAVFAGRASAVHPVALDESDGMLNDECTAGLSRSSGRLLFSTVRGVVEVDPKGFSDSSAVPAVRIEEVLLDGRKLGPGVADIALPPGPRALEIRYTGFNFGKAGKIRFRHRTTGRSGDWTDAGSVRTVRFAGLPPGKYEFEVTAANEDGRWNESAARCAFTVERYFWQTIWFQTSAVLFLIALGGGSVAWWARLRIRRADAAAEARRDHATVEHLTRVASLGELSSAIAHELNQPLAAIMSNAQAAQRFIAQGNSDPAELGEILRDIVADDQRASSVIQRLRVLLKKGTFEPQMLGGDELVHEMLDLMGADLRARGVKVVLEIAAPLRPIRGDRVQLMQVLINLVRNAADSMEGCAEDARILTLRVALRVALRESEALCVSVADSGKGIRPGDEEAIFLPYHTTKEEGLGLGLSLSRSIITAHGGSIRAENQAGGGAVFSFTLPLWKEEA